MRWLVLLAVVLFGAGASPTRAGSYDGKRILHIDSYHRGNEWNDRIAAAIADTLEGTGIELALVELDSKRRASEPEILSAAQYSIDVIKTFKPDVVIASDDNAAKYVVTAYKDSPLPFVFCGLNWDASGYGLPYTNVTGMVEVSPIPQIVRLLRSYARGDRIGYLAEDTETKRKELTYHEKLFGIRYDEVYLVRTFAEWEDGFRKAQGQVDMLMILGVGAIADWNDAAARRLAETETSVPAGTDFDWLMEVALIGVAKVPEEQGRWAARAALKILEGVPPSRIPLSYNKEGKLYFNIRIASRLGVAEAPPLAELTR